MRSSLETIGLKLPFREITRVDVDDWTTCYEWSPLRTPNDMELASSDADVARRKQSYPGLIPEQLSDNSRKEG